MKREKKSQNRTNGRAEYAIPKIPRKIMHNRDLARSYENRMKKKLISLSTKATKRQTASTALW